MLGKRKKQPLLFDVGNVYDLELDPSSFYAQLAAAAPQLFTDELFADLYSAELGRPSYPPSEMALLMLLQYHAGVCDEEAVERSAFDLRWAAVLRRHAGKPLCARTTLVFFRARLALNNAAERVFDRALEQARKKGLLSSRALKVILDTRPIIGRGAVEDTYNLIARCMDRLIRLQAEQAGVTIDAWAEVHDLGAYVRRRESSLKGSAGIDWSDARARQEFLTRLVKDARRLLTVTEAVVGEAERAAEWRAEMQEEYELLGAILAQDVREVAPPGEKPRAELKEGTERDRIPSATDPEQRHGHKSESKKFTGHKARVAVDAESQLIVDVEVLAGNAGDAAGALAQVERLEARLGVAVEATLGDCAYGGGATREEFANAERVLFAKVPAAAAGWAIPKQRFELLWEGKTVIGVTCPNRQTTYDYTQRGKGGRVFDFGECCRRCPLRCKCVKSGNSRTIQIHPQEHLLEAARVFQRSEEGKRTLQQRVVAEHALARLAQRNIGQARYFGRKKTRLQLLLTATVVNLRWIWSWAERQPRPAQPSAPSAGVGGAGTTTKHAGQGRSSGGSCSWDAALGSPARGFASAGRVRRAAVGAHLALEAVLGALRLLVGPRKAPFCQDF